MKKIIIIFIILVFVILVGAVIFLGRSAPANTNNSGATVTTSGSLPSATIESSTYNLPTGSTLTLGTSQGSVIVNNFYNNDPQISADHSSVVIEETGEYNISYYAPDSSFNILIEQTPFATIRTQAEAAFLQILGISQTDACKLNVAVAVPYAIDPTDADQNFGLSFCANSAFQTSPAQ